MGKRLRLVAALCALAVLAAACTNSGDAPDLAARRDRSSAAADPLVTIRILDEAGAAVDATVALSNGWVYETDEAGRVVVAAGQPLSGLVTADGFLTEPILVDPAVDSIDVGLLARVGRDGVTRIAMHFGGDVMLGRRYLSPQRPGTARVITGDGGATARAVVSDLAPIFAAADLSMANLETVIGNLPDEDSYPGKLYLLQSPTEVTAVLDELGIDLVTLGNNHIYDWLQPGIDSTVATLQTTPVAYVGAGATSEEAERGVIVTSNGYSIGVLSFTGVHGNFVNDDLPIAGEEPPIDLSPDDAWAYERRTFGLGQPGDATYLPPASRLPSEVWREYTALESVLTPDQSAELWAALTAPGAYPELLDSVARRGHGGAAMVNRATMEREIAALRARGADLVVVQLHAGIQFVEFTSITTAVAAHDAIDAGADMVIGHHPHVLQGIEWYKGRLIVSSLGNLVFDQDFLTTFPSATLRLVMAGTTVVQARVIPLTLDDYRPVPVTGELGRKVVRLLDARSAAPARSRRFGKHLVSGVIDTRAAAESTGATVTEDRGTGLIGRVRSSETIAVPLDATGVADLPPTQLLQAHTDLTDIEFGRDILGIGAFDDVTADGRSDGAVHWVTDAEQGSTIEPVGAGDFGSGLALVLQPRARATARARPVARVSRTDHRFVDADGNPADGLADYSIRLSGRRTGRAPLQAQIDVFHVDDQDPNRDPTSTLIRQVRVNLDVANDGAWHRVETRLPADLFSPSGGLTANAALIQLEVPADPNTRVEVDDVAMIEWREAGAYPSGTWHDVDAIRGTRGQTVQVTASRR